MMRLIHHRAIFLNFSIPFNTSYTVIHRIESPPILSPPNACRSYPFKSHRLRSINTCTSREDVGRRENLPDRFGSTWKVPTFCLRTCSCRHRTPAQVPMTARALKTAVLRLLLKGKVSFVMLWFLDYGYGIGVLRLKCGCWVGGVRYVAF